MMKSKQEQIIEKLFIQYGTYNPFDLTELLGIDVIFVEFLEKPLGRTTYFFGEPTILISSLIMNSSERFFVCAHELYHAIDHKNSGNYYISNVVARSKMEVEANSFAAKLILNEYRFIFNKMPRKFSDIQTKFGVPITLMEYYF